MSTDNALNAAILAEAPDLFLRALESNTAAPILRAPRKTAEEWVLVPRKHLADLVDLANVTDMPDDDFQVQLLVHLARIIADARVLGIDWEAGFPRKEEGGG